VYVFGDDHSDNDDDHDGGDDADDAPCVKDLTLFVTIYFCTLMEDKIMT
jgi:hypothetical protein